MLNETINSSGGIALQVFYAILETFSETSHNFKKVPLLGKV